MRCGMPPPSSRRKADSARGVFDFTLRAYSGIACRWRLHSARRGFARDVHDIAIGKRFAGL